MNKNVLLGVGGGLLVALGLVLGVIVAPSLQALAAGSHPAAAKATPTSNYCQLYEQTVLQNLPGVTQSELEKANQAGAQAVINKLYADGKITQAQQAQAQQELSQYANNPCAALQAAAAAKASGKGATSAQAQAITDARSAILAAVAVPLNTTSSALRSELASGKTIAQITTEKGASKSAVDKAYMTAVQAQLTKAVSDGALTQAQADMASSYLQQAVAEGHYPLLDQNSSLGSMLPAGMMSGQ